MSDEALWKDAGSVFRPSYSSTWLNCAGSLRPSQNAPDKAGREAAEGTVFHTMMSEWLISGSRPDYLLGTVMQVGQENGDEGFSITVNDDMFFYGQQCFDYAVALHPRGRARVLRLIEQRVDISSITPILDQSGTVDLAFVAPGTLHVVDWKYGKGIKVFAEQNTQLLLYACGLFERYDKDYSFEKIYLHIAQPRFNHWNTWEITRDALLEFKEFAIERAALAWTRTAARSPSPKACQWCKVRVSCPAMEGLRQALADDSFDVLPDLMVTQDRMKKIVGPSLPRDPLNLSTEDLARILNYRKLMEAWFKEIAEELTMRALSGTQVPGWEITPGRSKRVWRDPEEVAPKLQFIGLDDEQIFPRKLASPAAIERALRGIGVGGKLLVAYLRPYVLKPFGRPTLTPRGDNRLAVPLPGDESFTDDEEEEEAL